MYSCVLGEVRECIDGNAGMWAGGGVVAVIAGCEYMGGTRGSCVVPSADDVLEMSVG